MFWTRPELNLVRGQTKDGGHRKDARILTLMKKKGQGKGKTDDARPWEGMFVLVFVLVQDTVREQGAWKVCPFSILTPGPLRTLLIPRLSCDP
jgi:hypothetical protein